MKYLLLPILSACLQTSFAQPGTEIYLFDINLSTNSITIDRGKNITNRPGYDNQPFFHPDKPILYFVSADTAGRTDIFQFDFQTNKKAQLTSTHFREYSPTVTPDKKFLSCILQKDNGSQYLVKYPIAGGNKADTLIDNLTVGYHAWIDETKVVTFVLPQPFQLHITDTRTKKDTIVTERIGRSLHRIPKTNDVSFIQKVSDTEYEIRKVNLNGKITTIAKSLASVERDMTWTPDGKILMSNEKQLFFLDPDTGSEWKEIKLPAIIESSISRLAVNAEGNKLAVVVSEPAN